MPTPAKIPPSWGATGKPLTSPSAAPNSLLLPVLLAAAELGTAGARPKGGFLRPGIAGPVSAEGPDDDVDDLSISGADLSLVSVFLSRLPLVMSPRRAPWFYHENQLAREHFI